MLEHSFIITGNNLLIVNSCKKINEAIYRVKFIPVYFPISRNGADDTNRL